MDALMDSCALCQYDDTQNIFENNNWIIACRCNEHDSNCIDWRWFKDECSDVVLSENDKVVLFHPRISQGTAIVRGTKQLITGFHYWEVKLLSPAYGTDIMVGIGSPEMDMEGYRSSFVSALGEDNGSWGLSYRGFVKHSGVSTPVPGGGFRRGDIVSCFLDMWHKTLTIFINRVPIFEKEISSHKGSYYPFVCSTSSRTGFRLIYAKSCPLSLQNLVCISFQRTLSNPRAIFKLPAFPPGLRKSVLNNLPCLFFSAKRPRESEKPKEVIANNSSSLLTSPPSSSTPRSYLLDELHGQLSFSTKRLRPVELETEPMTVSQVLHNLLRMSASSPSTSTTSSSTPPTSPPKRPRTREPDP